MIKLTVFTPTFNRRYLLPRLYESLCKQTSKDFLWLIIDDGSSDKTDELVTQWQTEGKIEIQYHYKKNGGMHTGHNAAYQLIETELNVCIDSDDYMPEDAVAKIIKSWESVEDKNNISGIVGLDAQTTGEVLGSQMPEGVIQGSYHDLYTKYKASGDKKFVLKTEEVKKYPLYPEYENEKLVPLGILYIMMGEVKPFIFLNEILCIVEYQEGGSSNTIIKQYKQSPRGFAYARQIAKQHSNMLLDNFKDSIHLVSSAMFTKNVKYITEGPKVLLNYLALPFGVLLNIFIRLKVNKK